MTDDDKPLPLGRMARELLGVSADWFYRNRVRLEAEEGFPRPLPLTARPYRYDANAVRAWKARASGQGAARVEIEDPLEADRAALRERLPALAGTAHGGAE